MKILITSIVALFGFLPAIFAQGSTQVNYSAPLGHRTVYLNGTTAVPNGNSVWLGGFNSGFNVSASANNPQSLLSNWHEYDRTTINSLPPFNQAGSFSDSGTSTLPVFDNLRMYLWIFATDDGQAPAPGFANVTAYGLFTSSTDPDWVFPAVTTPFPGNTKDIYTGDAIQATRGNIDAAHLYLLSFNPVPEPSTLALLGIGVPTVVLLLRKRHQNR